MSFNINILCICLIYKCNKYVFMHGHQYKQRIIHSRVMDKQRKQTRQLRQTYKIRKITVTYQSDKTLRCRVCKELYKFNNKNIIQFKLAKGWITISQGRNSVSQQTYSEMPNFINEDRHVS